MDFSSKAHPVGAAGCAFCVFALKSFTKRGKGVILTAKKVISSIRTLAICLYPAMAMEPESVELTVRGGTGEKSLMLHESGANKLDKERDCVKWWKNRCAKRAIYAALAFGVICSLAGCQKSNLPQPDFPLEEDAILAALEQAGLPGVISESETRSSHEGHMAYTLRDPAKTYGDTGNKVVTAGISSAITEGERFLSMIFLSAPDEPATLPFTWEDWRRQIIFTTLLFGGFEDEEAVYRAFSDKETPEDEESFGWEAQLPGGYCTVSYNLIASKATSSFPDPIVNRASYTVRVTVYESKSLYQRMYQEMMDVRKEMERSPAQTPN
ncbi:MAG: hypothetical protein LLF87_06665 [Eubacteriales bacterium]|nr:hypothetical protein [Eubacteriales bacterium]